MGLALTLLAIGLNVRSMPPVLMLASILLYVPSLRSEWDPCPGYHFRIFPTKVRGRAASIATSTLWCGNAAGHVHFSESRKHGQLQGTFAIYGTLSFVCLALRVKMVPETKVERWSRFKRRGK